MDLFRNWKKTSYHPRMRRDRLIIITLYDATEAAHTQYNHTQSIKQ